MLSPIKKEVPLMALMVLIGMSRLALALEPTATVVGDISLTAADRHVLPASGVQLTLTCGTERAQEVEVSDERGEFRFAKTSVGRCSLVAELQGFKSASTELVTRDREVTHVALHLDVEPIYTGVTVTGEPPSRFRSQHRTSHRSSAVVLQHRAWLPDTASTIVSGCPEASLTVNGAMRLVGRAFPTAGLR